MRRFGCWLVALTLLSIPAAGQRSGVGISTVAALPATCTPGQPYIVTDGNPDCGTGSGSDSLVCACNAAGTGYVTAGTDVLTWEVYLDAASCVATVGTNNWDDSPTLTEPAAACFTATNVTMGVSDFDAGTDEGYQRKMRLPDGWTGAVDVEFVYKTADTGATEDVVWAIQTLCVDDAEVYTGSFNTANTVTDSVKTTTLQRNVATITGITTTGCAAGEDMILHVYRDANVAGDDAPSDASLIGVWVRGRRTI